MERTSSRWQIWMEPVKAAHDHMESGRDEEHNEDIERLSRILFPDEE